MWGELAVQVFIMQCIYSSSLQGKKYAAQFYAATWTLIPFLGVLLPIKGHRGMWASHDNIDVTA